MKTLSIIFIVLFAITSIHSQDRQNIKEQIDKIIHFDLALDFSESTENNDILIGVIVKDSTFIFHYGSKMMLTDSSIFEIGGMTKIFTAALIQKLIHKGDLTLSDTIAFENDYQYHPTIEALLSHQSGLPRIPDNLGQFEKDMNNPFKYYSKTNLLDYYQHFQPSNKKHRKKRKSPNSPYTYSHIDYALLRHFIDEKFSSEYNLLLNEYIINPLALQETTFSLSTTQKKRFVQGHSSFGQKMPPNDYNAFNGALGLKSSMRDLLRLTKSNIGLTNKNFDAIFTPLQMPVIPTKITKNAFMGLGWHIIKKKRYYNALAHVGVTKGHSSIIAFVKETQTGVVILSSSSKKYNNLAFLILRMLNFNWKKK